MSEWLSKVYRLIHKHRPDPEQESEPAALPETPSTRDVARTASPNTRTIASTPEILRLERERADAVARLRALEHTVMGLGTTPIAKSPEKGESPRRRMNELPTRLIRSGQPFVEVAESSTEDEEATLSVLETEGILSSPRGASTAVVMTGVCARSNKRSTAAPTPPTTKLPTGKIKLPRKLRVIQFNHTEQTRPEGPVLLADLVTRKREQSAMAGAPISSSKKYSPVTLASILNPVDVQEWRKRRKLD